jgi:hypothetical protein
LPSILPVLAAERPRLPGQVAYGLTLQCQDWDVGGRRAVAHPGVEDLALRYGGNQMVKIGGTGTSYDLG